MARGLSSQVAQVTASALDRESRIALFNSEGLAMEDHRTWSRFSVAVVAERAGERHTGSESPGERRGCEFFDSLDVESYTRTAAEREHTDLRTLNARLSSSGDIKDAVALYNARKSGRR